MSFEADDRRFVYAVARRIVASADDAEDCAQEALLLAYRHRDTFRGTAQYRTWLYRIAATTALGHLRSQRRSRRYVADGDPEQLLAHRADSAKSPPARLEEAEEHARLRSALGQLPASYRDVLVARAESGMHDVASRLGISVANAKIRAHRGRTQLRDLLEAAAA